MISETISLVKERNGGYLITGLKNICDVAMQDGTGNILGAGDSITQADVEHLVHHWVSDGDKDTNQPKRTLVIKA